MYSFGLYRQGYAWQDRVQNYIIGDPERFNYYDIRRTEMNDIDTEIINFLNRDDVKQIANTTNRAYFTVGGTDTCNVTIEDEFIGD